MKYSKMFKKSKQKKRKRKRKRRRRKKKNKLYEGHVERFNRMRVGQVRNVVVVVRVVGSRHSEKYPGVGTFPIVSNLEPEEKMKVEVEQEEGVEVENGGPGGQEEEKDDVRQNVMKVRQIRNFSLRKLQRQIDPDK